MDTLHDVFDKPADETGFSVVRKKFRKSSKEIMILWPFLKSIKILNCSSGHTKNRIYNSAVILLPKSKTSFLEKQKYSFLGTVPLDRLHAGFDKTAVTTSFCWCSKKISNESVRSQDFMFFS